jgi:REP element-mobilizing transposase RayT
MNTPTPIYTSENCRKPAFQLNWAISFFAHAPLPDAGRWAQPLRDALEKEDGIRILESRLPSPDVVQFLASTQPPATPSFVLQRLKGRLQYLLRDRLPKAFRRNYRLESVDSAKREVIEAYIQNQLARHPLADARIQEQFEWLQIMAEDVDLSQIRYTAHGQFIYNLHVVLEHADGLCVVEPKFLQATCDMIRRVCQARGFLLSRAGIVANHLHLAIGCGIEDPPERVALCFLNNLAYAHGMKAIYRLGYYVGTFGNFDLGAIRQAQKADEQQEP